MNTLYKELNILSNQDLAQVLQACTFRVCSMAKQILTERMVMTVEPGTRLSNYYIKHLNITFG